MDHDLQQLAQDIGLHFMGSPNMQVLPTEGVRLRVLPDGNFACDAQPALVTVSNSGIPSYLTNWVDPKVIQVLVSPMKAADVAGGESKKGDWLSDTAQFTVVENTGEVSTYGDYNENGNAGANTNFPIRQSYHYQTFTSWGEKEMARQGLTQVDWASQLNVSSVLILNKYQNQTYFYGVAGIPNYGLVNDPTLSAPIVPTTKVAGGTTWAVATAEEKVADVVKLYGQLLTQSGQVIDLETPMTLAMSSNSQKYLAAPNSFGLTPFMQLKTAFPNMKFVTAPEYATTSGELLQLIVETYEGQRTVDVCFTEKLRAHPIVIGSSSFKQKKSQGTWGAVWYRPVFCAQMIGV